MQAYPRDHADRFIHQLLRIDDLASTHGTWLNNIKLVFGEATPLISGDILRFGVDVERDDGLFFHFLYCD